MKKRIRVINYKRRTFVVLLFTLIFIVAIAIFVQYSIAPMVDKRACEHAQYITNQIIAEAIDFNDMQYTDLYILEKDNSGAITAARADSLKMSKLKAELLAVLNEKFKEVEGQVIEVPIWSILGQDFFSNFGPSLNLRLLYAGRVELDISSKLETAGINQIRYSIDLTAKTEVWAFLAGRTASYETSTTIPIADTIIRGTVPSVLEE